MSLYKHWILERWLHSGSLAVFFYILAPINWNRFFSFFWLTELFTSLFVIFFYFSARNRIWVVKEGVSNLQTQERQNYTEGWFNVFKIYTMLFHLLVFSKDQLWKWCIHGFTALAEAVWHLYKFQTEMTRSENKIKVRHVHPPL